MAHWDILVHSGQGRVRWPHWATHKASVAAEIRRQLQQTGACLLWWESPSRAYSGRVWCVGEVVALPLACHSAMALRFRSGPGFLLRHSQLWNFSLASPKTVSLQPTAVLSPRLFSKFHTLASSPFAHRQAPFPGWDMQGCGIDRFLGFPFIAAKLLFCHS